MPVDNAFIARLEQQLEQARTQLLQEDGERYRILLREISDTQKQRILDNLTDHHERVLFGLEASEPPRGKGADKGRSGDLTCEICGKRGLTPRGLSLHKARVHRSAPAAAGGTAEEQTSAAEAASAA